MNQSYQTSPDYKQEIEELLNKHSGALHIGEGDRSEILRVINIKKVTPILTHLINKAKLDTLKDIQKQDTAQSTK